MPARALREGAEVDFVVSTSPAFRKLTSHPTLLLASSAADFARDATAFSNVCSYDACLTDDEETAALWRRLAVSLGKPLTDAERFEGSAWPAAALRALASLEAAEAHSLSALAEARIDVIMRTGGRALATVERAVRSLERQTAGRIRLIFVRHGEADLSGIAGRPVGAVESEEIVEAPGANRGRSLAAGLKAVRSPFFAILDDDDYLLRDHFAGLLTAMEACEATHRFAYADVLRLNEGPGAGLELLKQGPAAGSLTSILERLPSHAFLATSATLARIRFAHWDMATAEDGLLIASLLRWATPLHRAAATAVYVQGAGDGSDFQEHPSRRGDELALHAETFAWRPAIESRFGPALDPLEFITPAARRLQDAERGVTASVVPLDAEWDDPREVTPGDAFLGGAFGGGDRIFVRVPLKAGRLRGASLYVEGRLGGVQIGAQAPWEIGLRADVSDHLVPGCATLAVAVIAGDGSALSCGLLDCAGALVSRTQNLTGARVVALGASAGEAPVVIVQAGAEGAGPSRLRQLRLGYALHDLIAAFDLPGDTARDAVVARLEAFIARQVSGTPAAPGAPLVEVDLRSPRCVYRSLLGDGPYRQGARRSLGSGRKGWDYFVQIHLPPERAAGAQQVRIELARTTEPFTVFLVDEAFTDRLSPAVEVLADKAEVEIWLPAPGRAAYVVFQAGEAPQNAAVDLLSVAVATTPGS